MDHRSRAIAILRQATEADGRGDLSEAQALYSTAADFFTKAARSATTEDDRVMYVHQAYEAAVRRDDIAKLSTPSAQYIRHGQGPSTAVQAAALGARSLTRYDRGQMHWRRAHEAHESGLYRQAMALYSDAAEAFLLATAESNKSGDTAGEAAARQAFAQACAAGERIKAALGSPSAAAPTPTAKATSASSLAPASRPARHSSPSPTGSASSDTLPGGDRPPPPPEGNNGGTGASEGNYSTAELRVLRHTSSVNGRVFLPWVDADAQEKLEGSGQFSDPTGLLSLDPKQTAAGATWARPSQFVKDPVVYKRKNICSQNVRQNLVADCSFVSALAISADFEKRFRKRLITGAIFPQNASGEPVYNPHGKYVVRLHFNGVWRKVVIDDRLPVSKYGGLLCSHSKASGELWVSLLEKAFLKVMSNSYSFPGSNSSVDLHALSGWIPDRLPIKDCDDAKYKHLCNALLNGKALLTIATGDISDADAERAGLVPTHAYAVLDMREIKGKRLLKLKNPWSRVSWRGHYSPHHMEDWTTELQRALSYDPVQAAREDNGEFWIEWRSIERFYDIMHINWDPAPYPYRNIVHYCWDQTKGPVKDLYNMQDNPQLSFVTNASEATEVFVLLSRHITDAKDFCDNKEFITVHIYRGGQRIFYPEDAFLSGTKINSPHYLARVPVAAGKQTFTFVVSQYEKANTIRFSLKVYSKHAFRLVPVPWPYTKKIKETGRWTGAQAGGAYHLGTHKNNPHYTLTVPGAGSDKVKLFIKLEAPRKYSVGLLLTAGAFRLDSGAYRPGFCYLELEAKGGDRLTIVPSTFTPGQEGNFFLTIQSSTSVQLTKAK